LERWVSRAQRASLTRRVEEEGEEGEEGEEEPAGIPEEVANQPTSLAEVVARL